MAGRDTEYSGEAWAGDGITVGYLEQEPQLDPTKTVMENVREAVKPVADMVDRFNEISALMCEPDADFDTLGTEMGDLQEKIDAVDGWTLDNQLEIAMDALRCPPGDSAVDNLSGGEKRRVALTKLLLEKPDILLLDEPTNHLDAESVAWLEKHLVDYPGNVILVTHDRYFLDNVVNWVLELDRGRYYIYKATIRVISTPRPSGSPRKSARTRASKRRSRRSSTGFAAARRRARPSQRPASAPSTSCRSAGEPHAGQGQILIQVPERLGGNVIEAKGLTKAYGDKLCSTICRSTLPPGGIVGVIGPNGAGKTTLFKLIRGDEQPDGGEVKIGETVRTGLCRPEPRRARSQQERLGGSLGRRDIFRFGKHEVATAPMSARSTSRAGPAEEGRAAVGGERNRVHMAKMLKEGGNVLLLDEPTNDLDVETLRALGGRAREFRRLRVVISHDRFFLDRLATHILAFEGNSHVEWFEGNFEAYEEDKRRRMGPEADRPHRMTYRKLTR
jgi:ATPase subunit of ABC transporter with duplicated ATPase domains